MKAGILVIGPPGAGKTTFCNGAQQFLEGMQRPVSIVNLDPAEMSPSYEPAFSISELITLKEVMDTFGLGPNGGLLYAMEYLEKNFDWLEESLAKLGKDPFVVFDLPGQVELSTDHQSLKHLTLKLQKLGFQLGVVSMADSYHITDASKYVALLLLSLKMMVQMELPTINVLSKIDLVSKYDKLPFNLEFYTDMQDLSFLETELNKDPRAARFAKLNHAVCELIEDYSFAHTGFETLCVEDKASMAALFQAIDRAIGYIPPGVHAHDRLAGQEPEDLRLTVQPAITSNVGDVQERYVDFPELHRAHELQAWQAEGDAAIDRANEAERSNRIIRAE
ncbi:hypothetical protein E5Q_03120 [Mixia osmundae IAM 14324]|uniref:GPN-loop GTPase 2 n=1 Tax=Mixia osmundae (strain CBS 9802 / IAM 14324 / JCM 22182 / KY 12970) TaxID=764103 RepID=G7E0U3_MIXOS|nr:hypothetical protein E5Q_03120 [Mixia osmundae IAM 14324]